MIDAPHMAMLQGVNYLAEYMTDESIAAEVDMLLGDHAKKIALCKIHNEEDAVPFFEDTMKSDDAW